MRHNKILEKVQLSDIQYMEGMQNYVQLYTTTRKLIVHLTFKSLEQSLPAQQYIRCHKSYIINLNHVQALSCKKVIVGGTYLPVGRSQRQALMEHIGSKLLS
ncbi:LytTR family DNA-binding domain-containing protein [Pontibacter korlensis]|uniref:LytR/AlgR family response regulator transcription factor n=1 Tax=Pontibacter korlensis TaxID=400092 RepID=UPI0006972DDC|nr:LytTR family DNA-binding domain-containing protein [Pontibacter korlensis]